MYSAKSSCFPAITFFVQLQSGCFDVVYSRYLPTKPFFIVPSVCELFYCQLCHANRFAIHTGAKLYSFLSVVVMNCTAVRH